MPAPPPAAAASVAQTPAFHEGLKSRFVAHEFALGVSSLHMRSAAFPNAVN